MAHYIQYNHILYTDNWYTSIKLAMYLGSNNTHLAVTIRKNSKLFYKLSNIRLDDNLSFWRRIITEHELPIRSTISNDSNTSVESCF